METYGYTDGGNLLSAAGATYDYDLATNAQAATRVGARELDYDDDGYLIHDHDGEVTRELLYDARGCLTSIEDGVSWTQYLCDSAGEPVGRVSFDGSYERVIAKYGVRTPHLILAKSKRRDRTAQDRWSTA